MYHSKIVPPISLFSNANQEPRKFVYIHEGGLKWMTLPKDLKLNYQMPTKQTKNYYFIRDLHGGKDGRVWLSISEAGKVAVCKLSNITSFDQEATLWNMLWCNNLAFTTKLLDANALIMPFVFYGCFDYEKKEIFFRSFCPNLISCTAQYIRDSSTSYFGISFDDSLENYFNKPMKVAEESLRIMAKGGYQHHDLSWRHVGLLPYLQDTSSITWSVKPVLIDLYDVSKLSEVTKLTIDSVVQEGLKILENEMEILMK